MKKILIPLILGTFILGACAPIPDEPAATSPNMDQPVSSDETATPQVNLPATTDSNLLRSNAYLDSAELLTLESYPLQFTLALKGNLPTPCNQLRVDVSQPDTENRIDVDVYSMVESGRICAQVLAPFEENVPLGSFPAGHYTLWVNGEQIAEFDA
jgi:inhibitor of cysteine peptidase